MKAEKIFEKKFEKKKKENFAEKSRLKIFEIFSKNFRRNFPEISATWRAAFSAQNQRKVRGRVGLRSAGKTRGNEAKVELKILR